MFNIDEFIEFSKKLDSNEEYKNFAFAKQPNKGESFAEVSKNGLESLKCNKNILIETFNKRE